MLSTLPSPPQTFLLPGPQPRAHPRAWLGQWPETSISSKGFGREVGPWGVPAAGQAACCCRSGYRGRSQGQISGPEPWVRKGQGAPRAAVAHQVGAPMVPALAEVHGHAGALLAAEVPTLAHTARGLPPTAVALGLRGVGFPARLFTGPQLPGGRLLPGFSRGALCQGRPPIPPLRSALGPASTLSSHTGHFGSLLAPQHCPLGSSSLSVSKPTSLLLSTLPYSSGAQLGGWG